MIASPEDRIESVQHHLWGIANDLIKKGNRIGEELCSHGLALRQLSIELKDALQMIEADKKEGRP